MRQPWLRSLRGRMILLSLVIVNVPILVTAYLLKQSAEQSLLSEKESKLAAIAALMDARLGTGGYEEILARHGVLDKPREERILLLNRDLAGVTDEIAAASPGLGVGYYSKDLDAILTYGPSRVLGHTVGMSIPADHPGRTVMEQNTFRVEFGALVRGNIMNAMRPVERQGRVIGYIWANELTDDVRAQLSAMDRRLSLSMGVGMLLSLLLILGLTEGVVRDVQRIVRGLRELRFDLRRRITGLRGEMGEIAETIHEMADSLASARSLSENIMASMVDGVIAVDTVGTITAVNATAERLTGFPASEIIGRPYSDIFCKDPSFESLLLETLQAGRSHIGSEVGYQGRRGLLWTSVSTSRLRSADGDVIGAVAVFKDLTERKRLEEQVQRANRLATLGELMAGVAHEIRNPLTSIKGFLQYFRSGSREGEVERYVPLMLQEVDRMNRIIDTMLYFARPSQSTVLPTDLSDVLRDTLVLVKSRSGKKDIHYEVRIDEPLPLVSVDTEQFRQVFLNLLVNAGQAISEKGVIRVVGAVIPQSGDVSLTFEDTGPGIPEEHRAKIFDPFFTTKLAGTGLGLAVVQRIVTAHGGEIHVGSSADGGASIQLIIPSKRSSDESGQSACG